MLPNVTLEDQESYFNNLKTKPLAFEKYGAPPVDLPTRGAIPSFFSCTEFKPVLSKEFLKKYVGKQPNWGPIGYVTYKRTYARPLYLSDYGLDTEFKEKFGDDSPYLDMPIRTEEYWETITRVLNGMWHILRCHSYRKNIEFSEKTAQRKAKDMFERMWAFKWLPPGRGLWMHGTRFVYTKGGSALNNCLSGDTEIITKQGTKKIADLVNQTVEVLTSNGQWIEAPIRSFGQQALLKLTLSRAGVKKEIFATADHRWFVYAKRDGKYKVYEQYTKELKPGSRLQYCFGQGIKDIRPSSFGIAHGIAFGDGTRLARDGGASWLYLCGKKDAQLAKYFPLSPTTFDPNKSSEGALRVADLPRHFKDRPSLSESRSYLYGWLAGYFAADGSINKSGNNITINSVNKHNLLFIKDMCYILGIGTFSIREEERLSNLTGCNFTIYSLVLMGSTLSDDFFLLEEHRNRYQAHTKNKTFSKKDMSERYWRVISVESTDRYEEVFCATVPNTACFALADNILTGNCAFISTADIAKEGSEPFTWAMDMSMLGVGVGFDTLGASKVTIKAVDKVDNTLVIEDSREGWYQSVGYIVDAYFNGGQLLRFDYSKIRPRGTPIKGFGGVAEGPQPLINCHNDLIAFFEARVDLPITSSDIVDIFNMIGACVVSGNVRRSAQIALGHADDESYITLKHHPDDHPACWNSNNSIYGTVGMDYKRIADLIVSRGEPGILWLDSVRAYGRMGDEPNYKDRNAVGTNPCSEQTLHNYELCTLVENFPSLHDNQEDFLTTLKQSYLYAKTVTLVPTHSKRTNRVMGRNSRIGCSLSGLQAARVKFGTRRLLQMLDAGYNFLIARDENYSDWLQVRPSIKMTSIKPSGTVSLLPGVPPGIHYDIERTYLRRIRFSKSNPMLNELLAANYRVYPAPEQPDTTSVVDFPVQGKYVDRVEREVSIWEQIAFVCAIQEVWADNQVSVTVKFDPHQPGIAQEIARALELFETKLKSISFLTIDAEESGYEAAPYLAISDEQYAVESSNLLPYDFGNVVADDVFEQECSSGACPVR